MTVALHDARMYTEFIGVFVFILVGTIAYVRYMATAWLTPFVILAAWVVLGILSVTKTLKRAIRAQQEDDPIPEDFDALMAAFTWLAWITYGVGFGNVDHIIKEHWTYAHGAIVVALVVLSHAELGPSYIWGIVLALAMLLFLPHPGMVSQAIDPPVLLSKILVFYFIFILVEVSQKLEFSQMKEPPTDEVRILAALVKVVQTVWILLSVWELIPFALLQAVILSYRIYKSYTTQQAHLERDTLPVRRPPPPPVSRTPSPRQEQVDTPQPSPPPPPAQKPLSEISVRLPVATQRTYRPRRRA